MNDRADAGAPPPLRVAVVDDEPMARRRIVRLLGEEPEAEVVAVCGSGGEAVEAVRAHGPDLVFLDVQMPEMDGFGVIDEVGPERMPPVVFITAFDQYAVQAFEVHAVDYLLKPFSEERFREAFRRAAQWIRLGAGDTAGRMASLVAARDGGEGAPGPAALDRFLVKHNGRLFFVPTAEVAWLSAESNYVCLHSARGNHFVRATMGSLEEKLDPREFVRIHRSTIVRTDRIKEIRPWFSGDYVVELLDGTELRMSRRFSDRVFGRGQ